MASFKNTDTYKNQLKAYTSLGGTAAEFNKSVSEQIKTGYIAGITLSGLNNEGGFAGDWDEVSAKIDSTNYTM
jgi:hypothetical protein